MKNYSSYLIGFDVNKSIEDIKRNLLELKAIRQAEGKDTKTIDEILKTL